MTEKIPLPSADSQYYDNTMLSTYKECPRKFYLRHVKHWRSQGTAMPLIFGLSWHAAQEVVWPYAKQVGKEELGQLAYLKFLEEWERNGMSSDMGMEEVERWGARTPMVAREMLVHYIDERWSMLQNCELVANELPFAVPMPGMEDVWYIGRIDKVVAYTGQVLAIEHKTTTSYKIDGGFQTAYIEGWYSDPQVKGYQFGAGLYYPGLTQVWVDAALVHKKVHDKFRFIPVAHSMPLLEEWISDTKEWMLRLKSDKDSAKQTGLAPAPNDDHLQKAFPKNEGQCYGKFGTCPFLDICRTTSRPDLLSEPPAGYVLEPWEPFSLLGLDKLTQEEKDAKR